MIENIVPVIGRDEPLHWQSHPFGEQSRRQIAEIAARHADDDRSRQAGLAQPGIGVEIVERLRQEARDVDRIGGGQRKALAELPVHKRGLDQPLTIVERAVDLERRNVTTQRRELLLLNLADLPFRVEYDYVDTLHVQKPVGYGAARIARRGDQYRDAVSPAPEEIGKHAGHETAADILERQRRSVKKFQRPDAVLDPDHRRVETQRIGHYAPQSVRIDILAEERLGHAAGDLYERKARHLAEKRLGQTLDAPGHVEPPVRGQSAHDGLLERSFRGTAVGTVVIHLFSIEISGPFRPAIRTRRGGRSIRQPSVRAIGRRR